MGKCIRLRTTAIAVSLALASIALIPIIVAFKSNGEETASMTYAVSSIAAGTHAVGLEASTSTCTSGVFVGQADLTTVILRR